MIKTVKVLNLISTGFFAVVLLFIYAYLPISVDLNIQGMGDMHKQDFFYNALFIFLSLNIVLRLIFFFGLRSFSPVLSAWSRVLIFILNFYLTVIIGFIGVWNNSTHLDPSGFGYLNYLGPLLLIIWVIGLIFLALKKV